MTDYLFTNDYDALEKGPFDDQPFDAAGEAADLTNDPFRKSAAQEAARFHRYLVENGEGSDEAFIDSLSVPVSKHSGFSPQREPWFYDVVGPSLATAPDLEWRSAWGFDLEAAPETHQEAVEDIDLSQVRDRNKGPFATFLRSGWLHLRQVVEEEGRPVSVQELHHESDAQLGNSLPVALRYFRRQEGVIPPDETGPSWVYTGGSAVDSESTGDVETKA